MKKRLILSMFFIILVIFIIFIIKKYFFYNGVFISSKTKQCIDCHLKKGIQTVQIKEWKKSKHAKAGVGCFECHRAEKGDPDAWVHEGFLISTIVSPKDCSKCHQKEYNEFTRSHHAEAGEVLGSLDNYLGEVVEGKGASIQGCQYCHGSIVTVKKDEKGKLNYEGWPNLGIGRLNPDGSKGTCSACHAKHRFSLAVARSPEACAKCHLGPDHPQKEIYDESKHGIIYYTEKDNMHLNSKDWILGKEYTQAPNCVSCHMGGNKYLLRTHDMGERLSWNLRAKVSFKRDNWEKKRENMQKVCLNCHGPEWIKNFYSQFDNTINLYNNLYAKPAAEIMNRLRKNKKLTKIPFDEEIEWVYFELWHHEGRRLRHGASMMGPDFVQWHGFYEIAKHFYFEFLPLAEKLGEKKFVQSLLNKPEHKWVKGLKPDNLKFQKKAFEKWKEMRNKLNEKSKSIVN